MIRSFNGSTILKSGSDAVGPMFGAPVTISGWARPSNLSGDKDIGVSGISISTGFHQYRLGVRNNTIFADDRIGGAGDLIVSSTNTIAAANIWCHGCAIFKSVNGGTSVFLNGRGKNTTTGFSVTQITHGTSIGGIWLGSLFSPFSGSIAEVGFWNTALTDNEVMLLAQGTRCYKIKPKYLFAYFPLGLGDPEPDFSGNNYPAVTSGVTQYAYSTPPLKYRPNVLGTRYEREMPMLFTPSAPSVLYGHNIGASFTRKVTTIGY